MLRKNSVEEKKRRHGWLLTLVREINAMQEVGESSRPQGVHLGSSSVEMEGYRCVLRRHGEATGKAN